MTLQIEDHRRAALRFRMTSYWTGYRAGRGRTSLLAITFRRTRPAEGAAIGLARERRPDARRPYDRP